MWWVLDLLALLFVTWAIASTRGVLYPAHLGLPPPVPVPSYTTHQLLTPEGVSFDVWVLEASSPRGRILLCHGYYADRAQVLGLADTLRMHGYEVLLFELRGHGARPGPCTLGDKEADDARTVLSWVRLRSQQPDLPIGVIGWSMGAVVALLVAARESNVLAVVTDSAYSRLRPVLQRAIRRRYHLPAIPWAWLTWWSVQLALGRRLSELDPASLAPSLRQSLLAIHGGADHRVEPQLGEEFYLCWAGQKARWFDPEVGHVGMFAHDPQAYSHRVMEFLDRMLGEPVKES